MKGIIILLLFSGLLFMVFLVALILGIIKKNKGLIILGCLSFLISLSTGTYAGYQFITKSFEKVTEALKPRTGEEIYIALFGKPEFDCLKIRNSQDQIIPGIDYAIWLHFQTCPQELKRILSRRTFELERTPTKGWNTDGPLANDNWFKPELLGDTILVYRHKENESGNGQTIYSNLGQTEAYCIDVLH